MHTHTHTHAPDQTHTRKTSSARGPSPPRFAVKTTRKAKELIFIIVLAMASEAARIPGERAEEDRCDGLCSHRRDWFSMPLAQERRGAIIGFRGCRIKELQNLHRVRVHMDRNDPDIKVFGRQCHF